MSLKGPWDFENPSCAEIGVDLFYRDTDSMDNNSRNEQNQILDICKSCPCVTECAEWGIARERWGIWGGLLPRQRELIRRRRRRNLINYEHIKILP